MNILTFVHFLNESLFTNVKKEFLQGDMRYSHLISGGESFEVEMNTDKITVIVEKVTKIEKVQMKSILQNPLKTKSNFILISYCQKFQGLKTLTKRHLLEIFIKEIYFQWKQ